MNNYSFASKIYIGLKKISVKKERLLLLKLCSQNSTYTWDPLYILLITAMFYKNDLENNNITLKHLCSQEIKTDISFGPSQCRKKYADSETMFLC
jgi:hypothetical protein